MHQRNGHVYKTGPNCSQHTQNGKAMTLTAHINKAQGIGHIPSVSIYIQRPCMRPGRTQPYTQSIKVKLQCWARVSKIQQKYILQYIHRMKSYIGAIPAQPFPISYLRSFPCLQPCQTQPKILPNCSIKNYINKIQNNIQKGNNTKRMNQIRSVV